MQTGAVITTVELYKLLVPLKEPFVISLGAVNSVQNLIVIIRTQDGCAGYGECSPFMTINGESVDTCFIVGRYFAHALKGTNALDLLHATQLMDRIIYANTSIKSAFDMALHDIAAQHAGLPLYRFLGGDKNKQLTTDMTVGLGTPEKVKQDAVAYKKAGFPAVKVKLGEGKEIDVARIKAIREGIGPGLPLRIDANQGWPTASAAIAVLKALEPFDIQHCEEPIPRHRFMELSTVAAATSIPIMADESCGDHHDAERLINLGACSMLNIKLGKSGGYVKAVQIVERAAAAGMHLQIGGFMESRLGMTAGAHLALTSDHIIHCDFDTPLMFTEDPVLGGMAYNAGGVIDVPDVPGLGAVIDERYLARAEKVIV